MTEYLLMTLTISKSILHQSAHTTRLLWTKVNITFGKWPPKSNFHASRTTFTKRCSVESSKRSKKPHYYDFSKGCLFGKKQERTLTRNFQKSSHLEKIRGYPYYTLSTFESFAGVKKSMGTPYVLSN